MSELHDGDFAMTLRSLVEHALAISVALGISVTGFGQTVPLNESRGQDASASIPSLDELGTKWLDVAEMAHMPSLHNFHAMAACSPDLIGINYNPDGQLFDWPTGPRWFRYITLPLVKLKINGSEPETAEFRWFPYQAVRRKRVDGLQVETTVRMEFEGPGLLYQIEVKNTLPTPQHVDLSLEVPGETLTANSETAVAYRSNDERLDKSHGFGDTVPEKHGDDAAKLEMVHAFAQPPDEVTDHGDFVMATWSRELKPGESWTLQLVMSHDRNSENSPTPKLVATAVDWAKNFDLQWDSVKARWAERWHDMFTPGNDHFSGHLPTLIASDDKLRDIYYRSLLTLLVLHRTNMKMCNRVFVTSGERDKGVVFFWDTSMWSKVFRALGAEGNEGTCEDIPFL